MMTTTQSPLKSKVDDKRVRKRRDVKEEEGEGIRHEGKDHKDENPTGD